MVCRHGADTPLGRCAGGQLSHPPGDVDRAVARGRTNRPASARDGGGGVQTSRPTHRDRQQAWRRWHAGRRHHGGHREAGRLHDRATAADDLPPALYAESLLRSDEGLYLHHPFDRLHLGRRGEYIVALENLGVVAGLRARQSRQAALRHVGRRFHAAYHDGADRAAKRHQMGARALQGIGRNRRRHPR